MSEHAHRWLLETPNGPTVEGVCQTCGATRTYRAGWDEDMAPKGRNGRIWNRPLTDKPKKKRPTYGADERPCLGCGKVLPFSAFGMRERGGSLRPLGRCRVCLREQARAKRAAKRAAP